MKKFQVITVPLILILQISIGLYGSPEKKTEKKQSKSVLSILKKADKKDRNNLIEIINSIDHIYSNLYNNLKNNKKLVIFFDPAHGKLPNGKWQGGASTRRSSCTNLPEEYYSILISRKMYDLLRKNRHIEVKTTEDFMDVLRGYNDSYNNIPFSKTVQLAKEADAFILISEHLNNISAIHKAYGRVNLPGIHITTTGWGKKMLTYVRGTYSGFLTLYNKLDASGFSEHYALNIKEKLMARGLKPNKWNFGAVGDSRFSYFVDFPVSVIYESGFISNPVEEKQLRDNEHIKKIVTAQYDALIKNIKNIFSVDISGEIPVKTANNYSRIELLKLSRLAIYYIKNGDAANGIRIIRTMEKKFSRTKLKNNISYFSRIKRRLIKSEKYYRLGKKYARRKYSRRRKYRLRSRKYFKQALRSLNRAPIYTAVRVKYAQKLYVKRKKSRIVRKKKAEVTEVIPVITKEKSLEVARASLTRNIILPIEKDQSLEEALKLALNPDKEVLSKLLQSFKKAHSTIRKKTRYYSRKRKRWIRKWKKVRKNIEFKHGIYIVKINKNLKVISARRTSRVTLNPWRYQNQQYLKNSYFCHGEKIRSL